MNVSAWRPASFFYKLFFVMPLCVSFQKYSKAKVGCMFVIQKRDPDVKVFFVAKILETIFCFNFC